MMDKTIAVILGGGAGSRLYPLTKSRSKPAVPIGGKYRLVDIPISNCLHSDVRQIYVLTLCADRVQLSFTEPPYQKYLSL